MKDIHADVIIIGGGASGLTAACVLAEKGREVAVVTMGCGSTYLSSGCIDVLGYSPSGFIPNPLNGVKELVGMDEHHPYSVISEGLPERAVNLVKESLSYFISKSEEHGMKFDGQLDENIWLMNSLGTAKPTCLAPTSMYQGQLSSITEALVVGIRGYTDFNPTFIAKSVEPLAKALHFECSLTPEQITVSPDANLEWCELQRMMEEPKVFHGLKNELRRLVKQYDIGTVGLPPIFGPNTMRQLSELEEDGISVFEVLMPFAPSGARLQSLFERTAKACGVKMMSYEVSKAHIKGKKCTGVTIESNLKKFHCSADEFILATGDILTGLHWEDGAVKEPLFNLNVRDHDVNATRSEVFPEEGHPLFKAGIRANSNLLPVNQEGKEVLSNVRVAGSLLDGYDYTVEKSGLGVAVSTGYHAGKVVGS